MSEQWQGAPIVKPSLPEQRGLRYIPALVWGLGLLTFLAFALSPHAKIPPPLDLYVHGFAFACLTVLGVLGFRRVRNATLALVTVLVVSVASEAAQYYVPGRTASLEDVTANLAGMGIGVVVGLSLRAVVLRRRRSDQKTSET